MEGGRVRRRGREGAGDGWREVRGEREGEEWKDGEGERGMNGTHFLFSLMNSTYSSSFSTCLNALYSRWKDSSYTCVRSIACAYFTITSFLGGHRGQRSYAVLDLAEEVWESFPTCLYSTEK